jgi:glycerol-3-phosphate dehydrogenase
MDRKANLEQLDQVAEWDVVIIGGGASGLGIALDSANRGYKTLLLEKMILQKEPPQEAQN